VHKMDKASGMCHTLNSLRKASMMIKVNECAGAVLQSHRSAIQAIHLVKSVGVRTG